MHCTELHQICVVHKNRILFQQFGSVSIFQVFLLMIKKKTSSWRNPNNFKNTLPVEHACLTE